MLGLHHLLHPSGASKGVPPATSQQKQQQQQPVKSKSASKISRNEHQQKPSIAHTPNEAAPLPATKSGCRAKEIRAPAGYLAHADNSHSQVMHRDDRGQGLVLIVNSYDEHDELAKPIVGRRLPSKSLGPSGLIGSSSRGYTALVQQEMANVAAANAEYMMRSTHHDKAPVVGRRSHRLQQVHQQQPAIVYQYDDEYARQSQQPQQPLSIMETHISRPATNRHQQAQLPNKSKAKMAPPTKAKEGRKKQVADTRFQSVSIMNIADHSMLADPDYYENSRISRNKGLIKCNSNCCIPTGNNHHLHEPARAIRHKSSRALDRAGSLSSSSGCSPLCHQSTHDLCQACEPNLANSQPSQTCMCEACCTGYEPFMSQTDITNCQSSVAGKQRVPPCCSAPGPIYQQSSPVIILHNHQQPQPTLSMLSSHPQQAGSHGRRTSGHHYSCQANGQSASHVHDKPASAYRTSSCQRERRQQHAPMIIRGQNVLPVHQMPNPDHVHGAVSRQTHLSRTVKNHAKENSGSGGRLKYCHPAESSINNDLQAPAVSQIYESLAAELKAKLGDPKIGPILLPPKDYDTISRKQGKLNGIELRRSTNPQLVGPAANTTRCSIINETKEQLTSEILYRSEADNKLLSIKQDDECVVTNGSARSSGRSTQDNISLGQRSRSNSSSGVGSISICAGSPNSSSSSKSSSSEDMRHAAASGTNEMTRAPVSCGSQMLNPRLKLNFNSPAPPSLNCGPSSRTSSIVDRKNCSPDNCGSDSGHSDESGQLESFTNVHGEQKIMLRNTSDNIYKPKTALNNDRAKQDELSRNRMQSHMSSPSSSGSSQNSPKPRDGHHASRIDQQAAPATGGRGWGVEIPLKVNSDRNNGNTYLATKQIIY